MSTQMFSLDGKVAVITGASRGIGRAISLGFARAGAAVAVAARSGSDLETLAKEIESSGGRALAVPTDVTDRSQLEALFEQTEERFGPLDIVVNNAGGTRFMAPLVGVRPDGWDKVMRLNLDAVFHATQLASRRMAERGSGSIVNLASIDGHGVDGSYVAYNVSKAALLHLTRQTAVELGPHGVRCNSVSPGWTRTPMVEAALTEEQLRLMEKGWTRAPLRRLVTPEEVARTVAFLAGPLASGVTGTDVVVDGGTIADLYIMQTLP